MRLIQEKLDELDRRIFTLKVEVTEPGPSTATMWEDRKNGRLDSDEVRVFPKTSEKQRFRYVFDGQNTTILKSPDATEVYSARRSAGLLGELSQHHWPSFYLGLRMPGAGQSLADICRVGEVTLRPMEKINGIECESIEVREVVPGADYSRIYRMALDPTRFYIPVRLKQFIVEAGGSERPEWGLSVVEFMEVDDEATKSRVPFPRVVAFESFFGSDGTAKFRQTIGLAAINLEIPKSVCRVDLATLPPGTLVEDSVAGKKYVVENRTDIYKERVERLNGPPPESAPTRPLIARLMRPDLIVLYVGVPISLMLIVWGVWLRVRQTRNH